MSKLKKELALILRGYKLIAEIDGVYLALVILNAVTMSFSPFFTLYMSSKLITELSQERRTVKKPIYTQRFP